MDISAFAPIHSALLGRADLAEMAALLQTHPARERAGACLKMLAERTGAGCDPQAVRAYQQGAESLARDGEVEVDDDAVVSMGDDGGAYVQAWLWVSDEAAGIPPEAPCDGVDDAREFAVISPDGFPSFPEPIVGMAAAIREKHAFIERYRSQSYYAAVGRRIPFEDLDGAVRIEPWDAAWTG
ncbi:MAG: hypothetical protein ABSA05_16340 [Opitutaceae bacterium]